MTAVDPLLADLIALIGDDAYLHITYLYGGWEVSWARRPHTRGNEGLVTAPELNDAINAAIEQQREIDRRERRMDTREYVRGES